MVVHILDIARDPFRPKEDEEELLEPEVPYLSAIDAILYLAQYTGPAISFVVSMLARYSFASTCRHWNGIKNIPLPQRYFGYGLIISICILEWFKLPQASK